MVNRDVIKEANSHLSSTLPDDYTAVFIGATSGIGMSALTQLVSLAKDKSITVYVIGRSAEKAVPLLASLRQSNQSATVHFIEQDISLVKNVDKAVDEIRKSASKIDLLFLSSGYIAFEGRKETSEGLDPSMTTRYYSRLRAIQLLLPLLKRSKDPRVTNILAAGQEGPLDVEDLDLRRPGNYSFIKGSVHSATMLTLMLERLASENPEISFVHAFPGLTATGTLTKGSTGIVSFILTWILAPILNLLVANRVDDVGAKALLYSTSPRYSVSDTVPGSTALPTALEKIVKSDGGVFLVGPDGEKADSEKVLGPQRGETAEKVWQHTQGIFQSLH